MSARVTLTPVRLGGIRLRPVGPSRTRQRLAFVAAIALLVSGVAMWRRHDSSDSGLADGYHGPPVVATVSGARTTNLNGVCEVTVRDVSSSVTEAVDPDRQLDRELSTVQEAVERASLTANDSVGVVVFSDAAVTLGPLPAGDPALEQFLVQPRPSSGTNFKLALEAAAQTLNDCAPGQTRHLTVITDGQSSEGDQDVPDGLAAIPDAVRVDVVVLGGEEQWNEVADEWTRGNTGVHVVGPLEAGVVARQMAGLWTDLTGQHIDISFNK